MGVALAAIADDGDILVEDASEIGVAVIIDAHDHGLQRRGMRNESCARPGAARAKGAFDRFFRVASSRSAEIKAPGVRSGGLAH
jgi:hypothetical protein